MGRRLAPVALVLALAACTAPPDPLTTGRVAAATARPVTAARTFNAPLSELGYAAVMTGVLVRTAGGCVALSDNRPSGGMAEANAVGGEPTFVVVWPPGVTATADGVEVPGSGRFRFGQPIRSGGGWFPWSAEHRGIPRVPRDCWGAEEPGGIVLLNLGG